MNTETDAYSEQARIDVPNRSANPFVDSACVVDVSWSMTKPDYPPSRLAVAGEACTTYVKDKVKHRRDDRVGIVQFSSNAKEVYPLSHVGSHADTIIASVRTLTPESSTDFCAGLKKAKQMLHPTSSMWSDMLSVIGKDSADTRHSSTVSKHILFLSDGLHSYERASPIKLAARLKDSGIVIDCVGIGSQDEIDEDMLRRIASIGEDGKPRYRFIGDKGALFQEFQRIARLRIL